MRATPLYFRGSGVICDVFFSQPKIFIRRVKRLNNWYRLKWEKENERRGLQRRWCVQISVLQDCMSRAGSCLCLHKHTYARPQSVWRKTCQALHADVRVCAANVRGAVRLESRHLVFVCYMRLICFDSFLRTNNDWVFGKIFWFRFNARRRWPTMMRLRVKMK